MPIYAYNCKACDEGFDRLRPVRESTLPASCPSCGGDTPRAYATPFSTVVAEDAPTEPPPPEKSRNRPTFVDRQAGGRAALTDSGGYRPALTHNARCPQCDRYRNVAVLGKFAYGTRLNCEACSYIWLYWEATAQDPMFEGYKSEYAPSYVRSIGGLPRGDNKYEPPARGA